MTMYRQGDILLIKREEINHDESNLRKEEGKKVVILEGSVTGHHHIATNATVFFRDFPDNDGIFAFIDASQNTKLEHEEHKTIPLPRGIYEVRRQREVNGYVED